MLGHSKTWSRGVLSVAGGTAQQHTAGRPERYQAEHLSPRLELLRPSKQAGATLAAALLYNDIDILAQLNEKTHVG